MLEIYNIKDKQEYLREVAILTQKEWGTKNLTEEEFDKKIEKKINKIISLLDHPSYSKLILIKDDNLVGFISIFPVDGDERTDLSPWYATMYVKKEYRGNVYSKMLNDAILEEARRRGFKKIYLKTDLVNYYEKFGAKYIEKLSNGESLYYIDL